MSGGWINAWPLLLIFAAGILFGRWLERRRWKASVNAGKATAAAIEQAAASIARGEFLKPPFGKRPTKPPSKP